LDPTSQTEPQTTPLLAPPKLSFRMTKPITIQQKFTLSGQVIASLESLRSVQQELQVCCFHNNPSLEDALQKSLKACQEANALLRAIGYIDVEELGPGPVSTSKDSSGS
jgi:hypothetical protein